MTLDDVIFLDNLPTLDLHGIDKLTASIMINDFIKENIFLKNKIIVIIHGIGTGVLFEETKNTLKKNRNVSKFKTFYQNNGATIVELKN